ncbi:MAG: hypothetical protein IPH77_13960 [Ignavibacteria bacterium]|nr:hypothetical protein [Ignavibacteria bacterium]
MKKINKEKRVKEKHQDQCSEEKLTSFYPEDFIPFALDPVWLYPSNQIFRAFNEKLYKKYSSDKN